MKIINVPFSQEQYYKQIFEKRQITLHHTAGRDNVRNVFLFWGSDSPRIATCAAVQDDGTIAMGFAPEYWAHHIGTKHRNNLMLNHSSIGIEICNWGGLMERNGVFYAWPNDYGRRGSAVIVPKNKVIEYDETYLKSIGMNRKNFHGFNFFERYTPQEIDATYEFINKMCERFPKIEKKFKGGTFLKQEDALQGTSGIFTHVNYRDEFEKSDCHPQPDFLEMLNKL